MNSEYWFGELAQSLSNGFFSDSVVLELARVSRDTRVNAQQLPLFEKAAEALQCAVEGSQWLDNPKMSEKASKCANFFGQAVDAMSFVVTPEPFAQRVQKLVATAKQLANGQVPSHQDINALRTFFYHAGRTQLEKTEDLMSGERKLDRLKWLVAR
ncbi:MAG: hypothetical protein ACRD4R_16545 [Candidatus Acidiferrales bacterium]